MREVEGREPAIIFDFGGVLLDWNPRYLYRKLLEDDEERVESFLAEVDFVGWNLQQDRGRPFAEAVAELSGRFPHHAELIRAFDERWEESIGGPISGTVDIARRLKRSGYSLYGLSNWSAETFRRVRHRYEFFELFEEIVISGEVGAIKPEPRMYQVLLERIGRRAEACLFIDDLEANVTAAARLGFGAILFRSPRQLEEELTRLGLLDEEEEDGTRLML